MDRGGVFRPPWLEALATNGIASAIAFGHEGCGGQAFRQVVDLPLGILGEPLVDGKKLLQRSVRVVIGAVVHALKWTRPCFIPQVATA
jgi:hypothetical protein